MKFLLTQEQTGRASVKVNTFRTPLLEWKYEELTKSLFWGVFCSRKSKSFSLFKKDPEKAKHESVKYSAARLYDKGVVLEIEGVPHNQ